MSHLIHRDHGSASGSGDTPADSLAIAQHALDLAYDDPRAAESLAVELLGTIAAAMGPARLVAQRALGRARHERGDLAGAAAAMRQGIDEQPEGAGSRYLAQLRMSLAAVLVETGSTEEALAQLDVAAAQLPGADMGRLWAQRAFIYNHLGRLGEAVDAAGRGLPLLRANGDRLGELRLLLTRAVSHLNAGGLADAEADLRAAQLISADLGHTLAGAVVQHSLGVVHARRGEIPRALQWYATASATYADIGRPGRMSAILEIDRAEALMHAGLYEEAVAVAQRAVQQTEKADNAVVLADARLLLARAQLTTGDLSAARASAGLARQAGQLGGRAALADLAQVVALEAEVAGDADRASRPDLLEGGRELARRLLGNGWNEQALYVSSLIAEWALRWNRCDLVVGELEQVHAARSRGRPAARARAWYVESLARRSRGDRRGARRAIMTGLGIIDAYRESLGASDLRARSAALAADLTDLGLELAVESGRTSTILQWAERSRARALRGPRVRPPVDSELGRQLAEVRRLESELRTVDAGSAAYRTLLTQLEKMENAVRDRSRSAPGYRSGGDDLVSAADLRRLLGPRHLVEYFVDARSLMAAVVSEAGLRVVDLGPTARVVAERDYLSFEVLRMGRGPGPGQAPSRVTLDQMILAPLDLPPDAEVVVVPADPLHGVFWSALPSLGGRVFTVAPSATRWARSAATAPFDADCTLGAVLGPDVPGGAQELEDLQKRFSAARALQGPSATCSAALRLLSQVEVAHVAAHGTFRRDSPLFSSFRLEDGPLTVYDLETIDRPPRLFVIASCHAGAHAVTRGGELLGMASALLAAGVDAVVAPVVAVPDLETAEFVRWFYQALAEGLPVAEALLAARRAGESSPSPGARMAAWSFVCFS